MTLVTQHIKIEWGKECRGAPYAEYRSHMTKALSLPNNHIRLQLGGYHSHYSYIIQSKYGFAERINRFQEIPNESDFRLGALEIINDSDYFIVEYRYAYHSRAIPPRRMFDIKRGGECDLVEVAMELCPDEYGRIIYNGRLVDFDTGEWYYNLDVVNIINLNQKELSTSIFTDNEPDKTYSQIAVLR
jgi:hypothetical protein